MSREQKGRLLFVYGTLKRNGALHGYLKEARFRGEATVNGLLYVSKTGWYPRMTAGNGIVHGELFDGISEPLWLRLDMAEGHPSLFKRTELKTTEGEKVWAYVYQPSVAGLEVVPDGKFDVNM